MSFRRLILPLAASLLCPATAQADPLSADAGVHRLDQAAIQKILDDAAARREARERAVDESLANQAHGVIGFSVGNHGYRSAFGTAVVPLPGDGSAAFSFQTDSGRDPYLRYR